MRKTSSRSIVLALQTPIVLKPFATNSVLFGPNSTGPSVVRKLVSVRVGREAERISTRPESRWIASMRPSRLAAA